MSGFLFFAMYDFCFWVLNRRIKCEAFFGVLLLFLVKFLASSLSLSLSKCMVNAFVVYFVFPGSDFLGFIFSLTESERRGTGKTLEFIRSLGHYF